MEQFTNSCFLYLERGQHVAEGVKILRRLDHDGQAAGTGQPEDDLRVGEAVELGQQFNANGGPGGVVQQGYIPVRDDGPDEILLRACSLCILLFFNPNWYEGELILSGNFLKCKFQ